MQLQFNTYEFILLFLPVTLLVYHVANRQKPLLGKVVLIAASLLFYGLGRVNMLLYLVGSMAANYLFVMLMRRTGQRGREVSGAPSAKAGPGGTASGVKGPETGSAGVAQLGKWLLIVPVCINVGLLLYFKYLNFGIANVNALLGTAIPFHELVLPLGISFVTFQQIAYVTEVWKGELRDSGLTDYLCFILYFPKLLVGPLCDPAEFIAQLNRPERACVDWQNMAAGARMFSLGLLKKVLLADTFARAVAWGNANLGSLTGMDCLLYMLFYSFQLYFDFSGYSDMATGVSLMLNIELPINFDSPYKAISERDMWRRWHVSLTQFLTRYIYIPLGGSRKGKVFTWLNIVTVFVISGLWHGAGWNYVAWGLLHGIFSCLDREFAPLEERLPKPVRWLGTFALWNVLTLLFGIGSVRLWGSMLKTVLRMKTLTVSAGLMGSFQTAEWQILSRLPWLETLGTQSANLAQMLLFTLAACVVCFIPENAYRSRGRVTARSMAWAAVCLAWGVLCLGAESSFVYFGF